MGNAFFHKGHVAGSALPGLFLCLVLSAAFFVGGCSLSGNEVGQLASTAATAQTGGSATAAPQAHAAAPAPPGLVISEVMSKNDGSLTLPDGSTPDWIELYNASSTTLDLQGYMLTDNARKPNKHVFPSMTVTAGGYLLLYATGQETAATTAPPDTEPSSAAGAGTEPSSGGGAGTGPSATTGAAATSDGAAAIYLPFKLSSTGEALILAAPDGTVADQWTLPELPADVSYGRPGSDASANAAKVYFGRPTPGKANGRDGVPTAEAALTPPITTLFINEYCTRNATLYDETGDCPDWVELYNAGAEPLDLTGYTLTDDPAQPDKWTFPKVALKPKTYLLLLLSGKTAGTSTSAKGRLHVDFRLGAGDTALVISDARGRAVASVPIEALPLNVSKGRLSNKPDSWAYFPRPTPGAANTTASFPTLSQATSLAGKRLLVSEVFALDRYGAATPQKDWIELYNNTDEEIDLTGYGLSDSTGEPFRMKLGGLSIAAKSTVVVTPKTFGISATGETIVLTDPSGVMEDAFATGRLRAGTSSGRRIEADGLGGLDRLFYLQPTRNKVNTTTAYTGYTEVPAMTVTDEAGGGVVNGLYIKTPVLVTLESTGSDGTIHYTLDGTEPTAASAVYDGPIRVDRSLVVKAIAVRPGYLPSDAVSRTVLAETPHALPVVSLSGDAGALLGAGGILAGGSGEVPVDFAFYEKDGRLGIDFHAGVELNGQFSRTEAQKSLEVKIRTAYGDTEVTYPFFPDGKVTTFRRLVLRTSGQDWRFTKVRDAFMTRVVQGQLDLDYQAVRTCVLYVNGQYYGLYELREKLDQFYVASHYGVDPDQVDVIKGNNIAIAGSPADMQSLVAYCRTHDLRDPAAYQAVLARIDEESLMDFVIAESFFSNPDSGNKKFWRARTAGGQYHWMIFDLDWALFPTTYQADRLTGDLLDPAGHGQDDLFDTTLQVSLLRNPDFREKFIRRYAALLNTTFQTDRMLGILDQTVARISDEMPRQIARWGVPASLSVWKSNVAQLRAITAEKRAMVIAELQRDFGLSQARLKELFPADFE